MIKHVKNTVPKIKVSDNVKISKYSNIFAKGYFPNWSEENFVIKNIKNTVPWTYVISEGIKTLIYKYATLSFMPMHFITLL